MKWLLMIAILIVPTLSFAADERYECSITVDASIGGICETFRGWTHMCQIYDQSYDGTGVHSSCSSTCLERTDIPDHCAVIDVRPTTNPDAHINRSLLQGDGVTLEDAIANAPDSFSWVSDQIDFNAATSWIKRIATCEGAKREIQKGVVVSLDGNKQGWIVRGIARYRAAPAAPLMAGDVLVVPEGSAVTVDLDKTGVLTISQKTRFQIPYTEADAASLCWQSNLKYKTQSVIGGAWNSIKSIFGDSYEIKMPSGTPGVRG